MIIRTQIRGVHVVASGLRRTADGVKVELEKATNKSARMVAKVARKQLYVARQISQQDAAKARKLTRANPVTMKVNLDSASATVWIRSHWARLRAKGTEFRQPLGGLLSDADVTRKSLVIRRRRGPALLQAKGQLRSLYTSRIGYGFADRQPPKRFHLRSHRWLREWAERYDRGRQAVRHVVRLNNPLILRELAADKTIQETSAIVIAIYRDAVVKGMMR